ncbi:retrotransposon protein, putative, ty1-copia subclass [Tanacetum coccineum]
MDGIVHTYKARLVSKGCTQTYGVDYEETFSSVADIRAIRILIATTTFYNYEIWQMNVKTSFLNGYLDEDIYMVFKMDNSKRGNIPMQERFDLNKTQGASTPEEVKRMQNVPYASVVGSIMYALNFELIAIAMLDLRLIEMTLSLRQDSLCFEQRRSGLEKLQAQKFILGLGIVPTINKPIKMFCDNSAALLIANELRVQRGTKHYHRRYHYVRGCIELGEINLLKVHKDDNLADPFTKALPKGKLTQHARSMRLRLASSFM